MGTSEARSTGDGRLIMSRGLQGYGSITALPFTAEGNTYFFGAAPGPNEKDSLLLPQQNPALFFSLDEQTGQASLEYTAEAEFQKARTRVVSTEILGQTKIGGLRYEQSDGSALKLGTDYFGKARDRNRSTRGPFEGLPAARTKLVVWPNQTAPESNPRRSP